MRKMIEKQKAQQCEKFNESFKNANKYNNKKIKLVNLL